MSIPTSSASGHGGAGAFPSNSKAKKHPLSGILCACGREKRMCTAQILRGVQGLMVSTLAGDGFRRERAFNAHQIHACTTAACEYSNSDLSKFGLCLTSSLFISVNKGILWLILRAFWILSWNYTHASMLGHEVYIEGS